MKEVDIFRFTQKSIIFESWIDVKHKNWGCFCYFKAGEVFFWDVDSFFLEYLAVKYEVSYFFEYLDILFLEDDGFFITY